MASPWDGRIGESTISRGGNCVVRKSLAFAAARASAAPSDILLRDDTKMTEVAGISGVASLVRLAGFARVAEAIAAAPGRIGASSISGPGAAAAARLFEGSIG